VNTNAANPFREWIRLEQPRLGSRVVFATDDFFAPKERLIDPAEPVFIADKYDDHGKWMDGWESRRKRDEGHDWCIVRLGVTGILHGVDIDTSFFTGNYPPAASIDGCVCGDDMPGNDVEWRPLVPRVELGGDAHHFLAVDDASPVTHLRLNIYPDGGVARLRIYGEVCADRDALRSGEPIDLAAFEAGGRALHCSDEHYGSMHNLNVAGRGTNMGDGWETARRRTAGNDWVIMALGTPGTVTGVEIDTAHFKGNYPDRAIVRAAMVSDRSDLPTASESWPILLPETKLRADKVHQFDSELADLGVVSHVRLDILPDGGVSRLRIMGVPEGSGDAS
jgi:allantoicase